MRTWRPVHALLAKLVLVCLAYFVAGRLGLAVPFTNSNISPIWPPAGIAVACILMFGYRVWPAILAGAFFTNFFSPVPHIVALGIAVGNTLATLAAAFLLKRASFHPQLNRLRDVLSLLWAGSLGTMVSASVGVATLYAAHLQAWSSPESAWLIWWLGDLMGIILVTPLVLSLQTVRVRYDKKGAAEFAVLALSLATAALLVFDDRLAFPIKDQMAALLLFPFIIWAAVRLGLNAVAVAVNVVAWISIWETGRASGPFVGNSPQQNAEMLQFFIAGLSITGLALSAVIRERDEVQGALEAQKALREAQELLRQHEKVMMESEKLATTGRMAATLAHEINNPLEAVTNFLYLMRTDQGLSEQSRMFLEKADEELRRVAHMTRHTLAFHKGSVKETVFDLQRVCEEVISLIRPRFESKRLRLHESYANGSKVTAIESETRQVISNLILNATQAAPAESTVTVIIDYPVPEVVRFAVEDCGSGISEENESRVFEPFFTTKEYGTGLGLWVSKDILRRNGGDLKLENRKNPTRFSASFKSTSLRAHTTVG